MYADSRARPVRYDRVFGDIRFLEIALLMIVSLVGGVVLALAATWSQTSGSLIRWAVIGLIAGYSASPITVFVLFRRRYLASAGLLYGVPLAVAIATSPIPVGVVSVPLTAFAFLIVAAIIPAIYPKHARPLHCCEQCEYDLRGNTTGVCPECGAIQPIRATK